MSRDNSGRPHELLNLRIGDVQIKNTSDGRQYAEVEIGRGGKTKARKVPLILSLPYFKHWIAMHPQGENPNAFVFPSFTKAFSYRNRPLLVNSLQHIYNRLKRRDFPKLIERPDVQPEDKKIIRSMLQKPWNPYLRRHISLTEKAQMFPNDYTLRLHAGWSKNSLMTRIYTHELGGESSKVLLQAAGIIPKEGSSDSLLPKLCPECKESNKPDAMFCVNENCGIPLSAGAYTALKDKKIEYLEAQIKQLREERYDQDLKLNDQLVENIAAAIRERLWRNGLPAEVVDAVTAKSLRDQAAKRDAEHKQA